MPGDDEDTLEHVYAALRKVIDPEVGLDIVTLGLVYEVQLNERILDVVFTLTTRGCPMESAIRGGITNVLDPLVERMDHIDEFRAHLVWEPRWDPSRIKEGALDR
jgi:metal-sulfur cluster biosynthetic enzyme